MSSREIALIVFACVFGSAMLGVWLGKVLPDRHLNNDAREIVKLATGLIGTLAALVLGLLVSSARDTFDQVNSELMQVSVKVVLLDRVLAQYGPEANEVRGLLKSGFTAVAGQLLSADESQQQKLDTPKGVHRLEGIQAGIRALSPQNDAQRGLQSRALEISGEIASSRWLLVLQRKGSISTALLVVMVFWLSVIFAAWGVFSPRNLIVIVVLLAASVSVSGATFVILELDGPLTGWIRVSPVPMQEALDHLGE
jgi:hypothetical protein